MTPRKPAGCTEGTGPGKIACGAADHNWHWATWVVLNADGTYHSSHDDLYPAAMKTAEEIKGVIGQITIFQDRRDEPVRERMNRGRETTRPREY